MEVSVYNIALYHGRIQDTKELLANEFSAISNGKVSNRGKA